MDRDSWVLRAPSNLVLNTSGYGTSKAFLGNLVQCLLISSLNFLSFPFKNAPPSDIVTCLCKKLLSIFFLSPSYVLEGCSEVSLEPSLFQADILSSFRLSSPVRCSRPLFTFMALLWATLAGPHLSCTEDSRSGHSSSSGAPQGQSGEGQ